MLRTIRELVLVTLLASVLVGWYLEYRSDALGRKRDADTIQYLKHQLRERERHRRPAIRRPGHTGG